MTPYPSTAALRGVDQYGSSAASVYSAAKRLLGTGAADDSRRVLPTAAATAAAAEGVMQPLHVRASASAAARAATGVGTAGDIDMAWLTEYATMYQAEARECTGCTGCDPPPYIGCFFPPAADPGPSFAYSLPVHSFHTRRDRVASLTTSRLHGAAIQRASPLGPGRALTLPCGWNNAGPWSASFSSSRRCFASGTSWAIACAANSRTGGAA